MRIVDGEGVIAQQDRHGTPYGLVFLDDKNSHRDASRYQPDPEPPRADPDTLHRVYSALLGALTLSPAHRQGLRRRGIPEEDIDARGYKTLPGEAERRRAMSAIRATLGGEVPVDVPGIQRGRIYGFSGVLIPVRDTLRRIVALKVRADDTRLSKYSWISTGRDDGPSCGAPCHVPVWSGPTEIVRVTEGPLKADVATIASGRLTLGVAGSSSARSAVEHLRAVGAKIVHVAWDMDARSNGHVAGAMRLAVAVFREEGFEVRVETWDESAGKGIDDALVAGTQITAHAGDAIDAVLAGMAKRPKVVAKIEAAERNEREPERTRKLGGGDGGVCFERGDSAEISQTLLASMRAEAPSAGEDAVVYDYSTFWIYDEDKGIYVELKDHEILRRVMTYAGCPVGPKSKPLSLSAAAAKDIVKAASWLCMRPGYLAEAPKGIVFSDAFVCARDGRIVVEQHSHEHRAIHALPVSYEANAPRRKWLEMMREIFRRERDDGTFDELDTSQCCDLLQEWVGSTLMGDATARAISLVLTGNGNDGKSSILSIIRALFPKSAVCSIAPQAWGERFTLAGLAGKRLNAVSELPERDILDAERFKAVVSGDPLTGERKNEQPFDMVCEAGHIFACNALPPTRDQSKGFWRRFMVIACDRSFTTEEAVRDLWKTILAEELAGIAAWAIEGAARAQTLATFTTPESSTSVKADWQRESDAVRQFIAAVCVELPHDAPSQSRSTITAIYPAFRAWCTATGHQVIAQNRLATRLKGLGLEQRSRLAKLYRVQLSEAWIVALNASSPRAGHNKALN